MLCGRSPFRGVTEYLTFQKVTAGKVVYPNNIPPIAKDIIDKLLVADPQNRLGSQNMSDLKSHPFFKGVSWDNILSLVPPQIKNPDPLLWEEDIIREEEERKKLVKERLRKEWSQFLLENEEIVQSGLIYKRRKLSIKKRFLILTSTPRLIYIDPKKKILKGEVPWSKKLVVEIKDDVDWRINTVSFRRMQFNSLYSPNASTTWRICKRIANGGVIALKRCKIWLNKVYITSTIAMKG